MKRKTGNLIVASAMSILLSSNISTDAATIATYDTSNTTANISQWQVGGQFIFEGVNGQIGFMGTEFYSSAAGSNAGRFGSQIGYLLTDNPSGTYSATAPQRLASIDRFTITSSSDNASRQGLEQITLYYGNNESQTITLPANLGSQTHTFNTPITTSYLY